MKLPDNVKFYVADTETTGALPEDKACEVGWVEVDEHCNVLSERQSILDPQRPISPSASGVHGLVNADCVDFPTIEEFFSVDDPACHGRKIEGPIVLIGHRISFDVRYIGPYIEDLRQELCTLRWARKLYPEADDHKLTTLMFALGLPRPQGAHRVMSDVYSALHLVKHICERTGATLRTLAEASADPMLIEIMPFGKHKGERFANVPKSYLRWMQDSMKDLDLDMRFTIDSALNKNKNKNEHTTQGHSVLS